MIMDLLGSCQLLSLVRVKQPKNTDHSKEGGVFSLILAKISPYFSANISQKSTLPNLPV